MPSKLFTCPEASGQVLTLQSSPFVSTVVNLSLSSGMDVIFRCASDNGLEVFDKMRLIVISKVLGQPNQIAIHTPLHQLSSILQAVELDHHFGADAHILIEKALELSCVHIPGGR